MSDEDDYLSVPDSAISQFERELRKDRCEELLLALGDVLLGDADPDLPGEEIAKIRDSAPKVVQDDRLKRLQDATEQLKKRRLN